MSEPLVYQSLVAAFEHSLLTQLRGHSAASPFLESWVPDEDPVLSLLNMLEAAEIAGETEIRIRIGQTELPAGRLPEIRQYGEEFGTFDLAESGEDWLLIFGEIGSGRLLRRVAPAYRAALRGRLDAQRLKFAGVIDTTLPGRKILVATQDGATLTVVVEPTAGIIVDARHSGTTDPVMGAVLDHFCGLLTGLPLQEAADHGGQRLIACLTAPDSARPVPGIVLPQNADPLFLPPCQLARQLLTQWRAETGNTSRENEFVTALESPWAALPPDQRASSVASALADCLNEGDLPDASLRLTAMEENIRGQPVRAIVAFAVDVAPENKPGLARRAEAYLKRRLDPHIELYVEELKDQNVIRRL